MPNKHKAVPQAPKDQKQAPDPLRGHAASAPEAQPFEKERDLDGYVDGHGHPQPHQSPLEVSFESEGALAKEEASQGTEALEELQDL